MSDVNLAFVVLGTVAGLVVGRLSGRSTPKPTPEPSARPASPDGGRVTYFLTPMQMEQVRDAWRAIRDASKHDHLCLRVEWKSAHLDDLLEHVAQGRGWHATLFHFYVKEAGSLEQERAYMALLPGLVAAARGQAAPTQEAPHV